MYIILVFKGGFLLNLLLRICLGQPALARRARFQDHHRTAALSNSCFCLLRIVSGVLPVSSLLFHYLSLCPTILRHNADGLSHSGRGSFAGEKYITRSRNHWGQKSGRLGSVRAPSLLRLWLESTGWGGRKPSLPRLFIDLADPLANLGPLLGQFER
jgi:hypothetical protein